MIKDIKHFTEEIEAKSYEILNRLKYNKIDIAIISINELIDYIRKFKEVNVLQWTKEDYLREKFRVILEVNTRKNNEYDLVVLTEEIDDIVETLLKEIETIEEL